MRTFTILKTIFWSALLLFLFTNVSFAQKANLFQDFEASVWASGNYNVRTVTDALGTWSVSGVGTMDDKDRYHGTRSIRLRNSSGDNCHIQMNFDKTNGIGDVTFYYASYSTHSGGVITLCYSTDGGTNWTSAGSVTAPAWGSAMEKATFTLNIQGNARVKIIREGAVGKTVNIDDLTLTDYTPSGVVAAPNFNPPGGDVTSKIDVVITTATAGATIRYTTNGTEPTESSTLYSTAIPISSTTTLKAKAWKTGMEPSAVSTAVYTFPQSVGSLSALRNVAPPYTGGENKGTTAFKFTGKAVVTHVQKDYNVRYIQDGGAAIMIFDPTGKMQKSVVVGDQITNLTGTLTNYFGMLEFIPLGECEVVSWGNIVPYTPATVADLDADHSNPIQAKVIKLENVLYLATGNFAKAMYYDLKQNNIVYDSVVYTDKSEAEYIGKPIPTYLTNIIGVCNFKGGKTIQTRNRIVPMDDMSAVKITNIDKSVIKLAPNPANDFVNIMTGAPMKMEIYSILGNLIAAETLTEGSNTISVSHYPSGVYMMKLVDVSTGQAFIQKLVVK